MDSQGHKLLGSHSASWPPRCPSACEQQRASALKMMASMAAGAKVHVPACSEDGDFLPLQCIASRCFCVDANGTNVGPAGGAVSCKNQTKHLTLSHPHSTRVSTSELGQESVQQQRNWSRSLLTYSSVCFRFREAKFGW